ncbi:hypothetical protein OSTOST_21990, partial [Ostertagia ostertagi]
MRYDVIRCDRRNRRGGGVAVIVKKSFTPRLVFEESVADSYELLCADLDTDHAMIRAPSCTAAALDQLLKAIGDLIAINYSSPVGNSDHASIVFTLELEVKKD